MTGEIRYDYSSVVPLLPVPWGAPFSVFELALEEQLAEIVSKIDDEGITPMRDIDVRDLREEAWKYRLANKDYYRKANSGQA